MPIIDYNGRIFGIVNVIDLAILIFFISLITGFLNLSQSGELYSDHDPAKKFFLEKNVSVILKDQPNSTKRYLEEGIQSVNDNASLMSILQVRSLSIRQYSNNKTSEDLLVLLQAKTFYDKNQDTYYYKSMPLKYTESLHINLSNIDANSTIVCIE